MNLLSNKPAMALVRREFLRSLRMGRPFAVTALAVVASGIIVAVNWPESDMPIATFSMHAHTLFMGLSVVLMCGLAVVVPGFGAASICVERAARTYDLLHTSLITSWGVVWGKLAAILGFYVLMVIACAPLLATVFFLIGIGWAPFLGVLGILAASAFSFATVSIVCSSLCDRVVAAVVASYFACGILMGGFLIPVGFVAVLLDWEDLIEAGAELAQMVSPIALLVSLLTGDLGYGAITMGVGFHILVGLLAACLGARLLRRAPEPVSETGGGRKLTWRQRLKRLVHGGPPKRFRPLRLWPNPLYGREVRYSRFARTSFRWRVFAVTTVMSLALALLFLANPPHAEETLEIYMAFQLMLMSACAPGIAASAITSERESDTLDLLRSSLLTPRAILWGKAMAAWRVLLPIWLSALTGFILYPPMLWQHRHSAQLLISGLFALAMTAWVAVGLSLLATTLVKRTLSSVVLSYLFAAASHFGLLLFSWLILDALMHRHGLLRGDGREFFICIFSPGLSYALRIIDGPKFVEMMLLLGIHAVVGLLLLLVATWSLRRRLASDS